jgi:DNA-binding protein H-NS
MATLESIQARIAKLQAQAEAIIVSKSTVVLDKIRELMIKHGISVAEVEAHMGKRPERKAGATAAAKHSSPAAKYIDPKTGATWSGRGRAPSWIANAKDRSKLLATGVAPKSAATAQKARKAGNYVRGPQAPKYQDPKSGATWSGRGRAPAWLAGAKDRSRFLIAEAATTASTAKAKAGKAAPAKTAPKTTAAKTVAARKVVTKKVAASARKAAQKNGAAAKSPVTRKARTSKNAAKSDGSFDTGVTQTPIEVASAPAAV